MNENTDHPNHPDNAARRDAQVHQPQRGQQVIGPTDSLAEPTLAVDLATAEIDRLIATAHRYPRKLDTVANQIEQMVMYDEASAENSVYALPRGGKPIVGPSIGFANSVATAWGNCWDDGHWIHTDRREKVVVSRGVFIDFQTGRRTTISEQRRIVDSKGNLFSDDMVIVTSKAASAVARRNAILSGVPRPLWFPVFEKALYVVRGTEATLPENRDKAIKLLANFGITDKQILMYLGVKRREEIGIEHIPTLRGMFSQLRDGSVTAEEMFDPRRMLGKGFDVVDNPLADTAEDEAEQVHQPEQQGGGGAAAPVQQNGGAAAAQAQTAKPAAPAETRAEPIKADPPAETAKPASATVEAQGGGAGPGAGNGGGGAAVEAEKIGPKSSPEYIEHANAWLDSAEERNWPSANIEETWKGERKMRERCSVVEIDYDTIYKRYREVLAGAKAREKK